jgi:sec-independent protein translocase protein TatA
MALHGITIWKLLIVLGIFMLLFGTQKLRNVGGDLGAAIRDFQTAFKKGEAGKAQKDDAVQSAVTSSRETDQA